ncbi:helix-turn-helix domain-containing protein [Streptomyces finlayi]|uniref:Helix-turn-helix domain-containing protein n=1 Tax=Streptomyces finlayi TaxID=67296 RepID=A0A7G7BFP7_9ACTN|nr:helix-turn-helix transcriptional regulator [Streptomyces finlayi]QNE74162.1 helix-turn-helix domain-containing protein [Streptomyces finlayi]
MCHPSWARARTAAHRLSELARLRRVRDRIDREYAQPLNAEALALAANMPAGHLGRQFRLAYGESAYAYLMARRVERATALLRSGDLGITEVSSAVGCPSPGTFSARFTERVGISPGDCRSGARGTVAVGTPSWVAAQLTGPVRNQEAPPPHPH